MNKFHSNLVPLCFFSLQDIIKGFVGITNYLIPVADIILYFDLNNFIWELSALV